MRRRIALVITILAFGSSFLVMAENEKSWSVGVGKEGIEVREVEGLKKQATTLANEQDGSAQRANQTTVQKHRILDEDPRWSKAVPICLDGDIDVAYVRLKKEFGYQTPEERLANKGKHVNLVLIKRREGYEYVAQESVYYLMRDRSRHTDDRVIQTELSKDGPNRYCLAYAFANYGLTDVPAFAAALKARYLNTLQR